MCDVPSKDEANNLKRQKTSTNFIQRNKEALANFSSKKDFSAKKVATPNMKYGFSQTPYGSSKKPTMGEKENVKQFSSQAFTGQLPKENFVSTNLTAAAAGTASKPF